MQFALDRADAPRPADDPHFLQCSWRDAELLPPPSQWGAEFKNAPLPDTPLQFDAATGKPLQWPLRFTLVHWAALIPGVPAGDYVLRCRTIDSRGIAQPLPRPYPKSGRNAIQTVVLTVASSA